jgi:response regulator RpfG family c-di-GMP phosphodiesterase
VLDSLVCASCYKPAWPLAAALDYLQTASGTHFDPRLVDLILAQRQAIEAIYAGQSAM